MAELLPRVFEARQVTLRWLPGRRWRKALRGSWEVNDTLVAGWVGFTLAQSVMHFSSLWHKVQLTSGAGLPITLHVKDAEVLEEEMTEGTTRCTSGARCSWWQQVQGIILTVLTCRQKVTGRPVPQWKV